jgi:hypothetical protein
MLESNVSVGDTCKEIGVTRHGSENEEKNLVHNALRSVLESKFRAIAEANRL